MNKISKFLFALAMPLVFCACSSDNDVEEPEFKLTPEREYELVVDAITDKDGEISFGYINDDPSQRIVPAYNEQWPKLFCESLLNDYLPQGQKATRTISEGYGSLTVLPSDEEGVYYKINFNIKDIDPFTLSIVTEEYYQNDNFAITRPSGEHLPHGYNFWQCYWCRYIKDYESRDELKGIPPCPNCGKY